VHARLLATASKQALHAFRKIGRTRIKVGNGVVNRAARRAPRAAARRRSAVVVVVFAAMITVRRRSVTVIYRRRKEFSSTSVVPINAEAGAVTGAGRGRRPPTLPVRPPVRPSTAAVVVITSTVTACLPLVTRR